MFEIHDLHKHFGSLHVLKGITCSIAKGQVVVIIGPSGSGKSTFLRCLNLLEKPTGGTIYVDGVNITDPEDRYPQGPGERRHGFPAIQPLPPI